MLGILANVPWTSVPPSRNIVRPDVGHPMGNAPCGDGVRFGNKLSTTISLMAADWGMGKVARNLGRTSSICWPYRLVACYEQLVGPEQIGVALPGARICDSFKC